MELNSNPHDLHRRVALRHRITRDYAVIDRDYVIGGSSISFLQVLDPDSVLDQIVVEADRRAKYSGPPKDDDELHLPYWAELWDSALGVGEWLVADSTIWVEGTALQRSGDIDANDANASLRTLNPLSILDLGCGMGLAGTVAAKLGHRVLFGDIEKPCLLFARYNAMQFDPHVRARCIDWKRDRLGERFNILIGSDVLYDKTQWEFLEPFWRAHLEVNGVVLLGEPGRQTGEMFIDWIAPRGWNLRRSAVKVATRDTPIKLFELRLDR